VVNFNVTHSSKNDSDLFPKTNGDSTTVLVVYMDNKLLTGNDEDEIQALKNFLDEAYRINDLGVLHYFLGLGVLQEDLGIILTQQKFALDLIAESGCNDFSMTICPLDLTVKLSFDVGELISDPTE